MSTLLAVALGLGLATAAGLRVFVPLFGAGLAAHFGLIPLHHSFEWLRDTPALIAFGTAMLLEIGAYYIPWVDHALDTVATPAALVAGVVTSAAVVTDLPPALQWGIALVGGGGAAGLMQALSVGTRIKSTLTTGGLGNPVVSTAETIGSASIVMMAVFVPVVCLAFLAVVVVMLYRWIGRLTWRRPVT